jgi:amino acid adenylation domain-containing protein
MDSPRSLHSLLDHSAQRAPSQTAVVEAGGGGAIDYQSLATLSDRVRDRLRRMGVQPGDRVGLQLRKSIDTVAAIFGIMKAGATYVPVDPGAPPARAAYILNNCAVTAAIVEHRFEPGLRADLDRLGQLPELLVLETTGGGTSLVAALDQSHASDPAPSVATANPGPDDLAYLLYTSGSTGVPKGVMLSQRNALCFVDWCSDVFQPLPSDRFSSHAPFHFDLSILDLYVPIKHAATVVLFGEEAAKDPVRLAELIASERITIWYSAPSILSLMTQHGNLPRHDYTPLRSVLFAGEVFPVKHLRSLKSQWPAPRYYNLYGPTETNVCTYHEIPPDIPEDRTEPYPIGQTCDHYRSRIVDPQGTEVTAGAEGELCINGPGVMRGYWNLPEQSQRAFFTDAAGEPWYRTGDIVIEDPDGVMRFLGRRDRMVKKRGYRVELGEIEAALYRHPAVKEAAVIATPDEELGVKVKAFLTTRDGNRLSLIELKRFCAGILPLYMVPDAFSFLESLPSTSTGKVDYQRLQALP